MLRHTCSIHQQPSTRSLYLYYPFWYYIIPWGPLSLIHSLVLLAQNSPILLLSIQIEAIVIDMFSLIATTALLFASSHAQDNTKPYGTNPIGGFSVEFLGNQTSDNSCSLRDLGFMGQIQGNW